MSNSVSSSRVIQSTESLVQKIEFLIDTDDTVVSQAMALDHAPDEFWCVTTTKPTDVCQEVISFDTANGEVDFKVFVENSGTIGSTGVYTVFLKWYAAAEQDGSSITVS